MAAPPRYVLRIARLPRAFELLAANPDGLSLDALAASLDAPVDELRTDLMAFYSADVPAEWLMGLSRPPVLEFLGPDGADVDPNEAEIVRIEPSTSSGLGVEYVDAGELGLVYAAARALAEIEPDNDDLIEAIAVLTETLGVPLEDADPVVEVPHWNRALAPLQEAARTHRRARIAYSRAWTPGVRERVIEPLLLVQTRRGWEVDAGPVQEHGGIRTFLLSNIRSVELLDETFDVPADVDELLAAQRTTSRIEVVVPHSARWAADMYAESVEVLEADEESVKLGLDLLPPLEQRVGMLLLAAGPEAFVMEPAEVEAAGVALAEELLVHHGIR